MDSKDVKVVLTNNAVLKNETIRRGKTEQHRDDVTATLLSNGTVSFNNVKDDKVFALDLSNCDSISISTSRNNALCIETEFNVNHLVLQSKSLTGKWYDTIVDVLNKVGYNFNMETDPKNRNRKWASQRLIRPKTSVRRKNAISAVPILVDGYADGQSVEATYDYIPPQTNNINEINDGMAYLDFGEKDNSVQSNGSYLNERRPNPDEMFNVSGYKSYIPSKNENKQCEIAPALPYRPKARNSKVVVDRIDDPVEPIASVDRVEPVASVDKTDVADENVNSKKVNEYLEPSTKNEHCFSNNINEYKHSPNTFRKRTNNLKSRIPDKVINAKVTEFREQNYNSRSHTKNLVQERSQDSLKISVDKKNLEGNIVLAMMPNGVLFIAGLKNSSLNHTLYEGDMIMMINKQRIDSIQDALRTIRNTATDTVDLVIVRLPYGKVVTIEIPVQENNISDLGFKLEGRKVERVDEEGLAAMAGLQKKTTKATELWRFTGTCVTAINCLPLSYHCTEEQTTELLSMHRDFVSLVMQPLDLIASFQYEIDSLETQN